MHLPSTRPEEKSIYDFSIAPLYTAVQVIVAVVVAFLGIAAAAGLVAIGIIPDENSGTAEGFGFLIGSLIALIPLVSALYLRLARHYFITTERIIAINGWLAQETISIDYPTITDLTVNRDVFERFITQSGNLAVDTAGSPAEEITFIHIANPLGVRDQILELVEKSKQLLAKRQQTGSQQPFAVAPKSAASPIATNPAIVDADDDGVIDANEKVPTPEPQPATPSAPAPTRPGSTQ